MTIYDWNTPRGRARPRCDHGTSSTGPTMPSGDDTASFAPGANLGRRRFIEVTIGAAATTVLTGIAGAGPGQSAAAAAGSSAAARLITRPCDGAQIPFEPEHSVSTLVEFPTDLPDSVIEAAMRDI